MHPQPANDNRTNDLPGGEYRGERSDAIGQSTGARLCCTNAVVEATTDKKTTERDAGNQATTGNTPGQGWQHTGDSQQRVQRCQRTATAMTVKQTNPDATTRPMQAMPSRP